MTPLVLAATVGLGAVGAVLRWLVMQALPHAPWWSLGIVNITGSAAIGVVAALPEGFWSYPLMIGLAGGLTTFSTLAVLMVPSVGRTWHDALWRLWRCMLWLEWWRVLPDLSARLRFSRSSKPQALRDKLPPFSIPDTAGSGLRSPRRKKQRGDRWVAVGKKQSTLKWRAN
jgi:hypothetical protein